MFAEMLYVHRRRCAMSQEVLAKRTGLSARSIRNLEAGSVRMPRPDTVRRLADGLALDGPDRERFESAAIAMYLHARTGEQGPAGESPGARIVLTEGTVAIGGGSLTLRWANEVPEGASGRELCVNLRGYVRSLDSRGPAELLHELLSVLYAANVGISDGGHLVE